MASVLYLVLVLWTPLSSFCYGNELPGDILGISRDNVISELKRELREKIMTEMRIEIKAEIKVQVASVLKDIVNGVHNSDAEGLVPFIQKIVQSELKHGPCDRIVKQTRQEIIEEMTQLKCVSCCNTSKSEPPHISSDDEDIRGIQLLHKRQTGIRKTRTAHNTLLDVVRRGRRTQYTEIAFSVYLDHIMDMIPVDTTIKFNKVDLNEGGFYNIHTGVFTAPIDGLYLFHFEFISFSRKTELRLVVDNVTVATALTAHNNATESSLVKASSTSLARVRAGQSVWVATYVFDMANIIAAQGERSSFFMGLLMY